MKSPKKLSSSPMPFNQKLVLNSYLLSLFGDDNVDSLQDIADLIKNDNRYEYTIDEQGISDFYYGLLPLVINYNNNDNHNHNQKLDKTKLLEYDNNIVRHSKKLTQKIKWKYFQYFMLLFTEIYLDRFFSSKENLLKELNLYLDDVFNPNICLKSPKNKIDKFELDDLNKIAFYSATGSGKTLIMHINLMQFTYYNNQQINKAILITPNSGLSHQHLKEFKNNGLDACRFTEESSSGSLFKNNLSTPIVEVLEISKLKENKGETTFAVDSFDNNNLVFIDEGHRGTGGDEWKTNRDKLSQRGFAFEYSATFGQAIGAAKGEKKDDLIQEYAKSIIFDYSYKHFYNDGFGKDYRILNLTKEPDEDLIKYNYLVGSLLSFYQQKKIFNGNYEKLAEYNITNPLMVFTGGKVTKTLSKNEGSDITNILKFIEKFTSQKARESTIRAIKNIMNGNSGITNTNSSDIFADRFVYLMSLGLNEAKLYQDILKIVFHTNNGGSLQIEELKSADGEIALKIGQNATDYFGVINIGDTKKFLKLCQKPEINLKHSSNNFDKSLFLNINNAESTINILIGSRKFTEGWSSWRVSTMGLLNMGKSEGSQVIQLFGRGVRLKGYEFCLKRSAAISGKKLKIKYQAVETLNIFGLKANYMDAFKTYLQSEGVPSGDRYDMVLPVLKNNAYKKKNLKILKLQEGKKYQDNENIQLSYDTENTDYNNIAKKVVINLYIQAQIIGIKSASDDKDYINEPHNFKFNKETDLAFLNTDQIYTEIIDYKNEKGYFNLTIDKAIIYNNFIQEDGWYDRLEAPDDYFKINNFNDYKRVQDSFIMLLKKYTDEFYKYHKNNYEKGFMVYENLNDNDNDANFIDEYQIFVAEQEKDEYDNLIQQLNILKQEIKENKNIKSTIKLQRLKSFNSLSHLYNPLFYQTKSLKNLKTINITPIELNKGEMDFIKDLEGYLSNENNNDDDKSEVFLLRNQAKTGIGFFAGGSGFYPDFIMWILKNGTQYINFIDPKGIYHTDLKHSEKINLSKTIKEKEQNLNDNSIILNSFIISNTGYLGLENNDFTKKELMNKNILFQKDDKNTYIKTMFDKILP
ncbi:MAG: restriction endonuclease subunit R [Gammaproteobacteria bacterium]|nr:MAG: restriction endonuclease subunit R [Gammaproteobacteria bacterium]